MFQKAADDGGCWYSDPAVDASIANAHAGAARSQQAQWLVSIANMDADGPAPMTSENFDLQEHQQVQHGPAEWLAAGPSVISERHAE